MLESDIAISAAGQTTYELARISLPTIMIKVAKNQDLNIKGWLNHGFCEYAGFWINNNLLYNILCSINRLKKIEIRQIMSKIVKELLVCPVSEKSWVDVYNWINIKPFKNKCLKLLKIRQYIR